MAYFVAESGDNKGLFRTAALVGNVSFGARQGWAFAPALCASPANVTPSTQLHLGKASELALLSTSAAPAGHVSYGARQRWALGGL